MSTAGLKAGTEIITGAVRKPSLSPARIALIAVISVFLIAVLRVVTGAGDLASSGAPRRFGVAGARRGSRPRGGIRGVGTSARLIHGNAVAR